MARGRFEKSQSANPLPYCDVLHCDADTNVECPACAVLCSDVEDTLHSRLTQTKHPKHTALCRAVPCCAVLCCAVLC
jgi:hypothetical protein